MKWFFLTCFIAAVFCALFRTVLIIFAIVTAASRRWGGGGPLWCFPFCFSFGARARCTSVSKALISMLKFQTLGSSERAFDFAGDRQAE